ncbi:hypothetical protein [Sporosarcina jiandibaonis]|uniref:hypothetical protein n=1 Tax=Sporosarcina jiandibaonis TaxID=2715535 RepID=UPI0015571D34|nr:hypothetical protein [Sporosarcina jiandibaonis]
MEEAKRQQKFISFEPNFRIELWGREVVSFIDLCEKALGYTDFVKLSEEEFSIITVMTVSSI